LQTCRDAYCRQGSVLKRRAAEKEERAKLVALIAEIDLGAIAIKE